MDRVTSSSTGSAYASDSDEFDSDLDEDDSDDDSEAEDSSADEADDSDDGRQLSTVASSDAGSLLKKPNLAQGGALRSRSIRARGVERKRAHEHMLQYDLGVPYGAFIRCDSWPSHDDVGGFFFEFEAVRTAMLRAGERLVWARRGTTIR